MPHPGDLSRRPLQQTLRPPSSPPLSQPFLARYGLMVRATVRACAFKNATATTQAKLTLGLFRTRSAHGLSQTTLWQPAPLHSPASPSSHSIEARRDRRRWPGERVLACLRRSSRLRIPKPQAAHSPNPPHLSLSLQIL